MSDPMNNMAQVRAKRYQREAQIRKLREGLMPWAQHIPWNVLGFAPRVLTLAGFVAALCGAGAWGLIGPFAAAALQSAADLPRRRRKARILDRAIAGLTALLVLASGIVLVSVSSLWGFTAAGWLVATLGTWGATANLLILATLLVSPVPKPQLPAPEPAPQPAPQPAPEPAAEPAAESEAVTESEHGPVNE
jgi:hypothetical protein